MNKPTCWCCRKESTIYDSGLCFDCWSWAETHINGDASEQGIRAAWREAHPDGKVVQTDIGPVHVFAVAPDQVSVTIEPFTLNGIAYAQVHAAVKRSKGADAAFWRVTSGIWLQRVLGGGGTAKAHTAAYHAAAQAADEATRNDERWLTVGAALHFDSEIETHRRNILAEQEKIAALIEAQRAFLREKFIEEAEA